jgi:excisionase family DNA binding protein
MAAEKSMSVRDTASTLAVSLQQVYKLVWDGRLSGQKVDGRWCISNASVRNRLDKKAGSRKSNGGAQ